VSFVWWTVLRTTSIGMACAVVNQYDIWDTGQNSTTGDADTIGSWKYIQGKAMVSRSPYCDSMRTQLADYTGIKETNDSMIFVVMIGSGLTLYLLVALNVAAVHVNYRIRSWRFLRVVSAFVVTGAGFLALDFGVLCWSSSANCIIGRHQAGAFGALIFMGGALWPGTPLVLAYAFVCSAIVDNVAGRNHSHTNSPAAFVAHLAKLCSVCSLFSRERNYEDVVKEEEDEDEFREMEGMEALVDEDDDLMSMGEDLDNNGMPDWQEEGQVMQPPFQQPHRTNQSTTATNISNPAQQPIKLTQYPLLNDFDGATSVQDDGRTHNANTRRQSRQIMEDARRKIHGGQNTGAGGHRRQSREILKDACRKTRKVRGGQSTGSGGQRQPRRQNGGGMLPGLGAAGMVGPGVGAAGMDVDEGDGQYFDGGDGEYEGDGQEEYAEEYAEEYTEENATEDYAEEYTEDYAEEYTEEYTEDYGDDNGGDGAGEYVDDGDYVDDDEYGDGGYEEEETRGTGDRRIVQNDSDSKRTAFLAGGGAYRSKGGANDKQQRQQQQQKQQLAQKQLEQAALQQKQAAQKQKQLEHAAHQQKQLAAQKQKELAAQKQKQLEQAAMAKKAEADSAKKGRNLEQWLASKPVAETTIASAGIGNATTKKPTPAHKKPTPAQEAAYLERNRQLLLVFYQKKDKKKVKDVDKMMEMYGKTRLQELQAALQTKYRSAPQFILPAPPAPAPAASAGGASRAVSNLQLLEVFYKKHDNTKVKMAGKMMEEYGAVLPELQKQLRQKYGSAPAFITSAEPMAAGDPQQQSPEQEAAVLERNRQLLLVFYQKKDKKKVKDVDKMMQMYGKTRLKELQAALQTKYRSAPQFILPAPPAAAPPAAAPPAPAPPAPAPPAPAPPAPKPAVEEAAKEVEPDVQQDFGEEEAAEEEEYADGGRGSGQRGNSQRGNSRRSRSEDEEESEEEEEYEEDDEDELSKLGRDIRKAKGVIKMLSKKLQRGVDDYDEEESCRHRLAMKRKALKKLQHERDRLEEEDEEDEAEYYEERHQHHHQQPQHHRPSHQSEHRMSQSQHRTSHQSEHRLSQSQHRTSHQSQHQEHHTHKEHHQRKNDQSERFKLAHARANGSKDNEVPSNRKLMI
jgi:hypothetical protein